ncbi:MAG: outer membrane lipoprotein carrier protein LolA [Alphaproteobacteria bacterium]|nr:outer membrane lipoprotein carrier protein LolA [Alphaproteobacteria bacterium]
MMRRLSLCLAAVLSVVLLGGAGVAPPQRFRHSYTDDQKALLDRLSASLNALHSLKARFIQIGPDGGVDQGMLYIQKPGQIRFEFAPPSTLLIVATGGQVYVKNTKLNTVDRYALSDTPLDLLLNQNLDLKDTRAVMDVAEKNGAVIVQARTTNARNTSNISLMFTSPGLELRQWTVKDAQGGNTTVALQTIEPGVAIDPALFTPLQKAPRPSNSR